MAIDPDGPVWFLFAAFCIVSTAVAYALEEKAVASLSALGAAWTLLWALASYFAVRGIRQNIRTTFSPIVCTAIAVVLLVIAPRERANDWVRLARASLVPLLTVLLTMGFGDFYKFPWVSLLAMFQPVEGLRPHVEEPVVHSSGGLGRCPGSLAMPPTRGASCALFRRRTTALAPSRPLGPGLPGYPWHATDHLPKERKTVYTVRFIQRTQARSRRLAAPADWVGGAGVPRLALSGNWKSRRTRERRSSRGRGSSRPGLSSRAGSDVVPFHLVH